MTLRKFPPFLYLLLFPLLLTTNALNEFPSSITLRAAVLTHAEPFAVFDPETGVYSGLQIELLDAIKTFATQDNISLTIELEEAPLYAYVLMLDRLSDNCNTTENPQPLEECTRYDMLIGDYYTNPERSMGVDFTPPWLRTAVSALKYIFSTLQGDVTTMEEAVRANATICVVYDSYMDGIAREKFPNGNYHTCDSPDDCVGKLKASKCALFVDDELQLRYRMVKDPTLQVTNENFNSQYIVWPVRSSIDRVVSKLIERWMYAAKSNATLDVLHDKYFSVNLCPLGKAGPTCDLPCHPAHGRSDRLGQCVCDSSKWTG
jgi:ABC-type amino acid transport substrate-binding protein